MIVPDINLLLYATIDGFAQHLAARSVEQALGAVETWLSQPHFSCLVPGPRHLEIAFRLLRALGVAANLTTDAQLAAYAIENQAELYSNDVDFGRFAELRWVNPLVG